ncbi:MAG: winged helix-turn-helix domain-containing protein [Comamonadaceae bacterium]
MGAYAYFGGASVSIALTRAQSYHRSFILTNAGNRLTMPYLKFLQLVNTVRQLPSYPEMDATEVQTLNALAQEWSTGNKISVLQAMGMLPNVSPSSVHRRLKTLRAKGFISLAEDEFDNRIKYIIGTKLFTKYLAQMDKCLTQALG